jgi:beta-phosphoglucomutase family hydrolase
MDRCRGAIFDLDGVITQTARVHFQAWKTVFDEYLRNRSRENEEEWEPFTYENDYLPYVDGKPRYQGVKSFLDSRDISIPYGEPSDPSDKETMCAIGNRKNELFRKLVSDGQVDVYQSTLSLVKELKGSGVKVGVASSSRNCNFILEKAAMLDLFETVIDGTTSKEFGLRGKPAPDIFTVAAGNLGLHPSDCLMVEDSIAGVKAGRNGNFALVIGVARNENKHDLQINGADIVVRDLQDLSLQVIENWFQKGLRENTWHLTYYGFNPSDEKLRETLTTVGNGYFATRGCFEGESADEVVHYPGTYIAGVYNKLPSNVYRRTVYNNDFVNCPNWLPIELRIEDSDFIHLTDVDILYYEHDLDMKNAVMSRAILLKDDEGRVTEIRSERIASMNNPHLAGIRYSVTPKNYSGKVTLRSAIDGTVINYGVPRYRELNSKHLSPISVVKEQGGLSILVRTSTSKVNICMHTKTILSRNGTPLDTEKDVYKDMGYISESYTFSAQEEETYTLEKLVSFCTSKDRDIDGDPEEASLEMLEEADSFDSLYEKHRDAWKKLWELADFEIEGDRFAQKVIHLHIYHLLVTGSPNNTKIDAGIPARGLHGEAYRGHVFWDELFVMPFYNLHFPEVARSFLMYRYRRLDAAREYARENRYSGAMYPWQTADDGKEETQVVHFNPRSGKWGPDLSRLQRHVSIAVAYNVWEYYYCTNDLDFLHDYGAEILVEVTRFYASIARYSKRDGRYHISGIMGPDEFHEKYPQAKKGGLTDNAYTNIMACWLIHKTIETVEHLPDTVVHQLEQKIGFRIKEMEKWRDIEKKMNVVIDDEGVLEQFDGFMDLLEVDWDYFSEKYDDIHRMDRIIKAEGDSPDRYQVIKQADTLMLFYLLSPGQVVHILNIMGYDVGGEQEFVKKNYDYYIERTSHGSTLSLVVHSAILKYITSHTKDMWNRFVLTLESDIYDTQGGTTAEAIHCGVMGGTLDILFKGFAGINIFKDYIQINPDPPSHWRSLSFKVVLRNCLLQVRIAQKEVEVAYIDGEDSSVNAVVYGNRYEIGKQDTLVVKEDDVFKGAER